jgi:predicted HTH transcriptional regulator
MLSLSDKRLIDADFIEKIVTTICAIANNGPQHMGKLIIGVTDKESDATRIAALDKITPRKVGKRFVVGIIREAAILKISPEAYFGKWKTAIKNSALSCPLKEAVLSNMDFNDYYGMGVMILTIPPQKQLSYVGENVYWREGDSTSLASTAKVIAALAQRFGTQN